MTTRKLSQHTPGPWEPSYGPPDTGMGCGYGQSQIRTVDREKAIAGVAAVPPNDGPMYRNGGYTQETFDTLRANANLIAAAPDLLAACEASLTGAGELDAETWELIKSAIAKARGETT